MKSIVEYINESVRLDEAKKVKVTDLLKGLDKIDKWNSANNIKKLMAEYMSAGDTEDLQPDHWKVCVRIVSDVADLVRRYVTLYEDDIIDIGDLTNDVVDKIEDGYQDLINWANKTDVEGDWDEDSIIDLFNTVSTKVCKEAWLI